MFKSFANCTANVVGADLESITPTPIFAALINISEEIRPLNINTLSLPKYVFVYNNHITYQVHYDVQYLVYVQKGITITNCCVV